MKAVIVFARYPLHGKVKTRLGKTLGYEFATRFYKAMAEHTFNVCLSLPEEYDLYLFCDDAKIFSEKWAGSRFSGNLQKGKDLGDKMKNSFKILFNKGYEKIIIIGTDCPDISPEILINSFKELSHNDITLGPSTDGGYYLLGMNMYHPFIFENIVWSSEHVFRSTVKKISDNRLSLYLLPELIDIDTEVDVRRWLSLTGQKNEMTELITLYGIG
jgi:rSAM/selenodomain-associated transferase 1